MPSILFSRAPRFIERTGPSLLSLPAVVFVGLLFLAPVVHLMFYLLYTSDAADE